MIDRTLPARTIFHATAEDDIRKDERDKIAAWLRGMDESTATTLANWLDAGMVYRGKEA